MERLPASPLLHRPLNEVDAKALYAKYPELIEDYRVDCPTCHKTGTFLWQDKEWECDCQDQLQRQKHYLNAGIGDTYQRLSFDYFVGDKRSSAWKNINTYMDNPRSYIAKGLGLYATGENGSGKTMLLALTLKSLVVQGYTCYMTTFANLIDMVSGSWRDKDERQEYKRKISGAQILFIDDIGKEVVSKGGLTNPLAAATLDSILRERAQNARPTFITTNIGIEQFKTAYGVSALSLMKENALVFEMTGDHRSVVRETKLEEVKQGITRPIQ